MNRILMIDCETLSLHTSAVVLQVAAQIVELDPYKVLFSMSFWPNLAEQADRKIDAGTVIWWMQRSPEAQLRVLEGHVSSLQPSTTRVELFKAFGQWLSPGDWGFRVGTVWSKPAAFDLALLTNYFGGAKPWHHRQERCMQTVARMLDPDGLLKPANDEGKRHDAMYDVEWQCQYLNNLYQLNPSLPGWDNAGDVSS